MLLLRCEVLIIASQVRAGRLGFLVSPKFGAVVAVVGVLVAVLALFNDVWGLNPSKNDGEGPAVVTPAPTRGAGLTSADVPASPATTTPAGSTRKTTGTSLFALSASPVDDRTVEVAVTPPDKPAIGQVYWFFVEVDWRDGNTDYYPREQLTGDQQTLTITIPPDATLQAERTGRVYRLTQAQSVEAAERVKRQQTTKDEDFFPDVFGAVASGSTKLPFGS